MAAGGFGTADAGNVLWITVVSFAVHPWLVFHPESPVFDEVQFGSSTN